ncbi:MAG: LysO family transporter [Bacteroidales bacterium]|jgi:uncharacterized membrane protein YbjE (DUF340 family)|nr:LysO family transporter [Bacteroidales bacterium]
MITVLLLMTAGTVLGWFIHKRKKILKVSSELTNWAIYLLLFLLGVSVGTNEKILNNFSQIGWQAISITLFAVAGSILTSWLTYIIFFKKNEG